MTCLPGQYTAMVASLTTPPHKCLTLDEFARTTWRQIAEIYCHDRDENEHIVFPRAGGTPAPEPGSFEGDLADINMNAGNGTMQAPEYAQRVYDLCKHYKRPLPTWFASIPIDAGWRAKYEAEAEKWQSTQS